MLDMPKAPQLAGHTDTEQRFHVTLLHVMGAFRLTQTDIAQVLRVEQATISRKMAGIRKNSWTLKDIDQFAYSFGMSAETLLFGDRHDIVTIMERGPFIRAMRQAAEQ